MCNVRREMIDQLAFYHFAGIFFLFACAASDQANLAFKTTIIEDTHLTLAGFLFKIEANISLIFLPLQTYDKKIAEFPFLFIFIIPWSHVPSGIVTTPHWKAEHNSQSVFFCLVVCIVRLDTLQDR